MNRKDLYPTLDGYLSFKECQEKIVFHALNIKIAGYDTAFMENRISSIEELIRLLKVYEKIANGLNEDSFHDVQDDRDTDKEMIQDILNDCWDDDWDGDWYDDDWDLEHLENEKYKNQYSDYDPGWCEDLDYSIYDQYPEQIWEEEEKFFDTKKSFQLNKKKRGFRNNKLWVKN